MPYRAGGAYTLGVKPPRAIESSPRLWVEQGEHVVGPVATVAVVGPIDKVLSYSVPPEIADSLSVGQRVTVPIGKRGRIMRGFCVGIDEKEWDSSLRSIESLVDPESFLTPDLLELGRWIARHYACTLGTTLNALVPDAVRRHRGHIVIKRVHLAVSLQEIEAGGKRIGAKQRALLDRLSQSAEAVERSALLGDTQASPATLRTLERRGWVGVDAVRTPLPPPNFDLPGVEPDFALNEDQQSAVARMHAIIDDGGFRVLLLFGVSGSGKTEVYIRSMRRVLAAGGQAMLLVPEIALTTQLVNRLASRFQHVAVVHSGLTQASRSRTWSAIRSGEKKVIIGTRSAVFAPCPSLGLIVVDEEQEPSYKNLQAPRFHVRDVAIKRGHQLDIPVLLGSATPSLESWHNCTRLGHFERIDLPHRVRNLPLPPITVVDINDEYQETRGVPLLSRVLLAGLEETLRRGRQAVLLMNRRGYANWIFCPSCKHRMVCASCNVTMVYHAAVGELICHYCRRRLPAPDLCPNPSCRSRMVRAGSGTQRIEERLRQRFPKARIVRVDSDTMVHERSYRRVIAEFEDRKIDCIVGTQMIAKGLDFPFVSFVGVIGADTTMAMTDFRAGERLFQLVTQVAGRAGRGDVPGEVVVQTTSPDAPSLRAAVRHDYEAFAAEELEIRRRTGMPPFSRLTRIVVSDPREPRSREAARSLAEDIRKAGSELDALDVDVMGPMPCALARLRNSYRFELIVRCASAKQMQRLVDRIRGSRMLAVKANSVVVDVDPVSLT